MPKSEWFRRKTWSKQDEEDFFARLARSRTAFHKAQYLRIQAYELSQVRDRRLTGIALELLERHLTEYEEPYGRMQAHNFAADCHDQLGQLDKSAYHFRQALTLRRLAPNHDCGTELTFAWFIVKHRLAALYDEALDVLGRAHIAFPIQAFRAAAARALIASSRRDRAAAAKFASEALEAASLKQSQFHYHRTLGLVGAEDAAVIETLRKLVAA